MLENLLRTLILHKLLHVQQCSKPAGDQLARPILICDTYQQHRALTNKYAISVILSLSTNFSCEEEQQLCVLDSVIRVRLHVPLSLSCHFHA
jgi:hypothetical protein